MGGSTSRLPPSLTTSPDSISWRLCSSGIFTVRSAYRALCRGPSLTWTSPSWLILNLFSTFISYGMIFLLSHLLYIYALYPLLFPARSEKHFKAGLTLEIS
jgi:hypothetical protein